MCRWFSILQNLNKPKMDPKVWEYNLRQAEAHIKFVFELYDMQVRGGRYFLHEHPAQASSWKLPVVVDFCFRYPHLYAVTSNMCVFGMTTPLRGGDGEGYVANLTRWLTNSPCLAETLDRHCPGDHEHTHLLGGRAGAAQVYPQRCARR